MLNLKLLKSERYIHSELQGCGAPTKQVITNWLARSALTFVSEAPEPGLPRMYTLLDAWRINVLGRLKAGGVPLKKAARVAMSVTYGEVFEARPTSVEEHIFFAIFEEPDKQHNFHRICKGSLSAADLLKNREYPGARQPDSKDQIEQIVLLLDVSKCLSFVDSVLEGQGNARIRVSQLL